MKDIDPIGEAAAAAAKTHPPRMQFATQDVWQNYSEWLDAADFQRFRRGLYPRLLNKSSDERPVVARKAS
ncbi:hypothetical protein [Pseudomonas syringae]|uniref:hypothetical protein n=1 Tax=Pseudomonas syringae TaxID=317 RepID=UPI000DC62FD1|nr:hypothetical protein [Pseudomonas syringae]SPE17235.1 hypothetical protein PSCFBP2116_P400024 [Pseudomonas syringae]